MLPSTLATHIQGASVRGVRNMCWPPLRSMASRSNAFWHTLVCFGYGGKPNKLRSGFGFVNFQKLAQTTWWTQHATKQPTKGISVTAEQSFRKSFLSNRTRLQVHPSPFNGNFTCSPCNMNIIIRMLHLCSSQVVWGLTFRWSELTWSLLRYWAPLL